MCDEMVQSSSHWAVGDRFCAQLALAHPAKACVICYCYLDPSRRRGRSHPSRNGRAAAGLQLVWRAWSGLRLRPALSFRPRRAAKRSIARRRKKAPVLVQ